MTLAAFLHGYPPDWSMGGEISTHRTLATVPGSNVFTPRTTDRYILDGVTVIPSSGANPRNIAQDAKSVGADVLYAHSALSEATVRAAQAMRRPSILAVHAPRRYARDLKRAWPGATIRMYNTEESRKDWRDPDGWLLHPPIGPPPTEELDGPRNAYVLTSSLLNKGVVKTMELAERLPDQRFIIVRSPAHKTHGSPDFEEEVANLLNVEVWDRLHPDDMHLLWSQTRILLVPSRYETYGLVALEAAWYGIPSVHVDTPHVREGIGEAARLLQSPDELGEAVAEVDGEYEKWAELAYDRVQELHEREVLELEAFVSGVNGLKGSRPLL